MNERGDARPDWMSATRRVVLPRDMASNHARSENSPGEVSGPEARACAGLVAFHRGESRPLELMSHESEPGRVRIDYRSGDQEGVALCHVQGREDGTFEITGAVVDENRLNDDQIAAFEAGR